MNIKKMLRWLSLIDKEMQTGRSRLKVINYTRQIRLEIIKYDRNKQQDHERKQSNTGR